MDKKQEEIIKKVSDEINEEYEPLRELYLLYFEFLKKSMQYGEHDNFESQKTLRVPRFGVFYPSKRIFDRMMKFKNESNKKKKKMKSSFDFGDIVYKKISPDMSGIVVGKFILYGGAEKSIVDWNGQMQTDHYDFELLTEEEAEVERFKNNN